MKIGANIGNQKLNLGATLGLRLWIVSNFVHKMCTKFKLSMNSFNAWFNRVVEVLDNRIKLFRRRGSLSLGRSKPLLNKPNVRKDIWDLHDGFVIVPEEQTANNFVVVCKKFYVEVLMREFGIDTVTFISIGNGVVGRGGRW